MQSGLTTSHPAASLSLNFAIMDQQPINPYQAPSSDLGQPVKVEDKVPSAILTKIRTAWIAATISAGMTLILSLVMAAGEMENPLFNLWNLIDVFLILMLAFGIAKRNRVCATIMFLYFVLSKIWLGIETGQFHGGILAIIFMIVFFRGMLGTFQFHQWKKRGAEP